jgi:hypothetical protein
VEEPPFEGRVGGWRLTPFGAGGRFSIVARKTVHGRWPTQVLLSSSRVKSPILNIAKDAMFSMGHPRGSAQSGFSIWLGRSVVLVVEISGGGRGSAREFRGPSSGKERPPQDDSVGSSVE